MDGYDPHPKPWREDPEAVTHFAETDSRNRRLRFGIKAKDRSRHMYVIGKTGMGKSTLLENLAVQDIQRGEGLTFIDPHGSTAEKLLEYVPEERMNDVLYFAPFDLDFPISFNVLEKVDGDKRHLVVNGLMATFEKIWVDAWSARMAYILQNTLLALLEYPDATLLGVNRMYTDKEYRKRVIENVTDPSVRSFWTEEFAKYTDRYMQEATPAIQNKIGQFSSTSLVRNIIGQSQSSFNLREIMDKRKIFIVNLSKGKVGEGNANLLGSMLITKLYLAAMSRADVAGAELRGLPPHHLYVDEFQSFANKSFADILSEARKYKLALTIAHQYIEQMEEEVRAAVFGNVGTTIAFRVGSFDAEVLEKEFSPVFTATDLVNLGFAQIYLKLMIDGVSSSPFSATTLPPIAEPHISHKDRIIASSRAQYARPREQVTEEIRKWHEPFPVTKTETKGGGGGGADRGRPGDRGSGFKPSPRPQGEFRPARDRAPQQDRSPDELRAVLSQIAVGSNEKPRRERDERPRDSAPRQDRPREERRAPAERPRDDRPGQRERAPDGPMRREERPQQNRPQRPPSDRTATDAKGMTANDREELRATLAGALGQSTSGASSPPQPRQEKQNPRRSKNRAAHDHMPRKVDPNAPFELSKDELRDMLHVEDEYSDPREGE